MFLAAAVVYLLAVLWLRRVELVQVPMLWHRARTLLALQARVPDDPAFQQSLTYGLSPFYHTLCRLIRLQRPDFLGGRDFQLETIRTREGGEAFFAHYEALEAPFDQEPDPDAAAELVIYYCPVVVRQLAVLDSAGRVKGDFPTLFIAEGHPFRKVPDPDGRFERLRVRALCHGVTDYEFSVDRDGLIDEGRVTEGDLQAAIDGSERKESETFDVTRVVRLLDSSRPGDLYRGLKLLEWGDPRHLHLMVPFLDHPDPRLRARAATLLVKDPSLAPLARPLLHDPSPRVRFAGLESARNLERWEEAVRPLTSDPRPEVARAARFLLIESEDLETARDSLLHLYRARDDWITGHDCSRLGSRELAEAMLSWLEDLGWDGIPPGLDFNLHTCVPAAELREFLPRLLLLYQTWEPDFSWRRELAIAIASIDDPAGNELLSQTMAPEEFLEVCERARGGDDD